MHENVVWLESTSQKYLAYLKLKTLCQNHATFNRKKILCLLISAGIVELNASISFQTNFSIHKLQVSQDVESDGRVSPDTKADLR